MAFDYNLVLRDGTVDLDSAEDAVPVIVLPSALYVRDEHGANALDIRKTGAQGLVAVMICPTAPTVTYGVTLAVHIQHADYYDDTDAYTTIASFPTLYTFVRKVRGTSTTAFTSADLLQTLTASGTGTDTGTIVAFDSVLETVGNTGDIYVAMVDAGDTYANVADTLTSGGGGIATMTVAGIADPMLSYGVYQIRFMTEKRYVRASVLAGASANWGKVQIMLTNAGYGGL